MKQTVLTLSVIQPVVKDFSYRVGHIIGKFNVNTIKFLGFDAFGFNHLFRVILVKEIPYSQTMGIEIPDIFAL